MNFGFSHHIHSAEFVVKTRQVRTVKIFLVLRAEMCLRNLVLMKCSTVHQYSAGLGDQRPESKKCLPTVVGNGSVAVFLSQLTDYLGQYQVFLSLTQTHTDTSTQMHRE